MIETDIPSPAGILTDEDAAAIRAAGGPSAAPPHLRDFFTAQLNQYDAFRVSAPRQVDLQERARKDNLLEDLTLDFDKSVAGQDLPSLSLAPDPETRAKVSEALTVDAYIQARTGPMAFAYKGLTREVMRDAVAVSTFGEGKGTGSDTAFMAEAKAYQKKNRDFRKQSENAANAGIADALTLEPEDFMKRATRMTDIFKSDSTVGPENASKLRETYILQRQQAEGKIGPLRPVAREINALLATGKTERFSEETQANLEAAIDKLAELPDDQRGLVISLLKSQANNGANENTVEKGASATLRGLVGQLRGFASNTERFTLYAGMKELSATGTVDATLNNPTLIAARIASGTPLASVLQGDTSGGIALPTRQVTEKEQSQVRELVDKMITRNTVAGQAIGILDDTIDPIKTSGLTQELVTGAGYSLGAMAPMALPYAGVFIAQGGYADEEYQRLIAKGAAPEAAHSASQITGAVQAAVERVAFLFNFVPSSTLGKLSAKMMATTPMLVGGKLGMTYGVLGKLSTVQGAEYAEEIAQAAAPAFTAAIAPSLGINLPEQAQLTAELNRFQAEGGLWRPDTYAVVAALIFLPSSVHGVKSALKAREYLATKLADPDYAKAMGIKPEQAIVIAAMPKEERIAAYQESFPTRDTSTQVAAAAASAVAAKAQKAATQSQQEIVAAEAAGITINRTATGWDVTDTEDGTTLSHATAEEASATMRHVLESRGIQKEDTYLDTVDAFMELMDPGRTIEISNKKVTMLSELEEASAAGQTNSVDAIWDRADEQRAKENNEDTAKIEKQRIALEQETLNQLLADIGDDPAAEPQREAARAKAAADANAWAQTQLKALPGDFVRDLQNPDSRKALDRYLVLGRSRTEVKNNVVRSISRVMKDGQALDLIEEQVENDLRENVIFGNTTYADVNAVIDRLQAFTGDTYRNKPGQVGIIEAWSTIVRLYATGTAKGNRITRGARQQMLADLREQRKLLPSEFRSARNGLLAAEKAGIAPAAFAKMREYLDYLKSIMGQVSRLMKAKEAGVLDDLEAMIRESVGLKEQDAHEKAVTEAVPVEYNMPDGLDDVDPTFSITTADRMSGIDPESPTTEPGESAPDVPLVDPDEQTEEEGWQEIPWTEETGYSVTHLPTAFPPLTKEIYDKIKSETDHIYAVWIDRMRVGNYKGIDLQGGMFYPTIKENLKAGVVWAYNSVGVATGEMDKAAKTGGYMKLILMQEGNVIGNKTFTACWFVDLRENIASKKLTETKALSELNRIRAIHQEKTKHTTPWETLEQAEQEITDMGQITRGGTYFQKSKATTKERGEHIKYQALLTQGMTRDGFPDAEALVAELEEPSMKGLPIGTMVGIIQIDANQKPMSAAQAGVPEHRSYKTVLEGRPVARMTKFNTVKNLFPEVPDYPMNWSTKALPMDRGVGTTYSITTADRAAKQAKSLEMKMTRTELLKAIDNSSDWKDFYTTYQYLLDEYFGDDATAFQSILSITSQATSVKANVGIALRMYGYWKRGEEFDGKKRGEAESGALEGVLRNLERWRDDVALSGRKISNYHAANEGAEEKVVVDRHVAGMLFGTKTPSAAQFTLAEKILTDIAREIGWQPRQVQAALWAASIRKSGLEPASYDAYLKTLRERGTIYDRTGATPGGGGIFAESVERPIRKPAARRSGKADQGGGKQGFSITTADRHAEYLKARESGNKNLAQRLVNQAAGIQGIDASIDRNGAHSPSGPEDGAPLWDATSNGIYPDDIYSQAGLRYYGTGDDAMDREAHVLIQAFRGNPNRLVKVYRALEKDGPKKIQPGEWVTTVRAYAKEHGINALNGDYKIISETVHARDIFTSGDSWAEWGYHPQPAMPSAVNRGTDPTPLSLEQFQRLSVVPSFSITTADRLSNVADRLASKARDPEQRFKMYESARERLAGMARAIGFRDDVATAASEEAGTSTEARQANVMAQTVDRFSAATQAREKAQSEATTALEKAHEEALLELSAKSDVEAGGAQADGWTADQKDALKVRQQLALTTLKAKQKAELTALETKQRRENDTATTKERQTVKDLKETQAAELKDRAKVTGAQAQRRDMLRWLAALDTVLMPFPSEVRGKVGGFVQLAGLRTNEQMESYLKDRIEKLDKVLETHMRKEYTKAMARLLKKAEMTKGKPGEKAAGKLGPDVQHLMDTVKMALAFTADDVNAHNAALQTKIDSGNLTPEQEALALREIELVQLAGDWNHSDSAKRSAALKAATETYEGGYLEWKNKLIAKRERRAAIKTALIADTGTAGTKAERDARAEKDLGWWGKTKDFFLSLSSFEEVTRYVFGHDSTAARDLVDAERTAAYAYEDGRDAMSDAILTHFRALSKGSHLAGEKLRFRLSQKSIEAGGIKLSEMEAIQALLMWNQEDGKRHMEGPKDENNQPAGAWNYDQAWVDEVASQMTPEGKATMAFIQRIYAAEWATLNPLYRERHGVNLPRHDNYAPITVAPIQAKAGEMVDPVSGNATTGSILTPGSLRTRSRSAIAEPDFKDALQVLLAHHAQMEHWKAYYDFAVEAQAILGNRDVTNSVKAAAGAQGDVVLRKWIDLFSQGGSRDAGAALSANQALSTVSGRAARMAFVGRVGTLLIQSTQMAAAIAEMPTGAYIARLGKLLSGNLGWGDAIRSEFIQRRISEMPPIVRQAMAGLDTKEPNAIKHAVARLGTLISGADGLFTAGTYAMLLDYHRGQAAKQGFTGPEADSYAHAAAARATERVAQPTRPGTRSLLENTMTNPTARLGWAFASEARQKIALAAWAGSNAKANPSRTARVAFLTFIVGGLMAQVIRNAWRDWRDDDDDEIFDERNWSLKQLSLSSISGPLQGIPVFGEAVQSFIAKASGTYVSEGNLLSSLARSAPAVKHLATGDFLDEPEPIEETMKDVEAILMAAGLANDTIAATASLMHILRDGTAVLDGMHDDPAEIEGKAKREKARDAKERSDARKADRKQ